MFNLQFEKIRPVKSPELGTRDSAGLDFFLPDDFPETTVFPGNDVLIPLGIRVWIPHGTFLEAKNRSSVATKKKLIVGASVVDSDYDGEVHAHLFNVGSSPQIIRPGEKIIQFVLIRHESFREIFLTERLIPRREGGFGHTDKR